MKDVEVSHYSSIVYHRVVRGEKLVILTYDLIEPANKVSDGIFFMLIGHTEMVHELRLSKVALRVEIWHWFNLKKGKNCFHYENIYLGYWLGHLD